MNGDDAWQNTDGPTSSGGPISIPTGDVNMNGNGGSADDAWATSARHTPPGGGRGRSPPRRSRSRSPRRNGGGGEREGGGGNNPGNNLHVSGLSSKVDTKDLEAAFSKLGRVQKASVMYDPHSRESRGFGFVTMETAEEAEAAIAALNATEFFGKTLNVEKARRGRARTPTPGRYYGPPKRDNYERPYDPRPYDSRYSRGHDDDRRGGGRYREERGPRDYDRGGRDYDRGYRDYDRRYDDRRY